MANGRKENCANPRKCKKKSINKEKGKGKDQTES